jgi:hypothetical protein
VSLIFQKAVGPAGPCASKSLRVMESCQLGTRMARPAADTATYLSNQLPKTPRPELRPPICIPSLRHRSSLFSGQVSPLTFFPMLRTGIPIIHGKGRPPYLSLRGSSDSACRATFSPVRRDVYSSASDLPRMTELALGSHDAWTERDVPVKCTTGSA